jgi:hypothetical protein
MRICKGERGLKRFDLVRIQAVMGNVGRKKAAFAMKGCEMCKWALQGVQNVINTGAGVGELVASEVALKPTEIRFAPKLTFRSKS